MVVAPSSAASRCACAGVRDTTAATSTSGNRANSRPRTPASVLLPTTFSRTASAHQSGVTLADAVEGVGGVEARHHLRPGRGGARADRWNTDAGADLHTAPEFGVRLLRPRLRDATLCFITQASRLGDTMRKRNFLRLLFALIIATGALAPTVTFAAPAPNETRTGSPTGRATTLSADPVATIVRANPGYFGGIWFGADSALHVSLVGDQGRKLLAGIPIPISFSPAPRSLSDIASIRGQLAIEVDGDTALHRVYREEAVDESTSTIRIGLTELDPSVVAALHDQFGDAVTIKLSSDDTVPAAGRQSDTHPFIAGDNIHGTTARNGNIYYCSTGFAARRPDAAIIFSAGHCGPSKSGWTTGSETVGHAGIQELRANGYDSMLIVDKTYAGRLWIGPSSIGASTETVAGTSSVIQGSSYCADGAATGTVCGAVVSSADGCHTYDYQRDGFPVTKICHLAQATARSMPCKNGDSGGPVYLSGGSSGNDYAAGIIIACGSTVVVFHPINALLSHFSSSIVYG